MDRPDRPTAAQPGLTPLERAEGLMELAVYAMGTDHEAPVWEQAVRLAARGLGLPLAKLVQVDPGGQSARVVASVGWPDEAAGRTLALSDAATPVIATLRHDGPIVMPDLTSDPIIHRSEMLVEGRALSGISVVVRGGPGPAFGTLSVYAQQRRPFSPDDVKFLADIARVLTARHMESLREDSEAALAAQDARTSVQDELARQAAALRQVNQELDTFAYSVSHDLRTPLRAVEGFSTILIEDLGPQISDEGRDYLNRIVAAAKRMSRLLEGLLSLSRVARAEVELRDVDLSQVGRDVIKVIRYEYPNSNAEVVIEPGMRATTDAGLIAVLLENLLANAIKFSREVEHPHITFRRDPDHAGRFLVEDNGVGFDPGQAGRLFRPFERLHDERQFPGTGIGLATVRRIVTRLGGDAGATSEPGQGATFWFTLGPE